MLVFTTILAFGKISQVSAYHKKKNSRLNSSMLSTTGGMLLSKALSFGDAISIYTKALFTIGYINLTFGSFFYGPCAHQSSSVSADFTICGRFDFASIASNPLISKPSLPLIASNCAQRLSGGKISTSSARWSLHSTPYCSSALFSDGMRASPKSAIFLLYHRNFPRTETSAF